MSAKRPEPQNIEAEEAVLAALLLAGADDRSSVLDDVRATRLTAGAFYYAERHGLVYRAIVELAEAGQPTDAIAVVDRLERRGELDRAGGKKAIHELAALAPATGNAAHWARIVRDVAVDRRAARLAAALDAAAANGGVRDHPELLEQLEQFLRDQERDEAAPARELVLRPIEEFAAVREPGAEPLASATGGGVLIPSNGLVIVFGDGGAGKSTLVLDLCFALAAGRRWLDLVDVPRPLRIAVIENEGAREELRRKLERKLAATGARLDGRIRVLEEPWEAFTFADTGQRRALAAALVDQQIDLLVVGPLTSVGMEGGGTPDEIRRFEQLLREQRELVDRSFAILLVHHENRQGQISGAWERVPDTLIHVTGQGHGRTRVFWKKARWASAMHGTTTHLVWADGESYTVEARPEVTADSIADGLLAAARAMPGTSWTKIRELKVDGQPVVRGKGEELAKVRDRLLAEGLLVNSAARDGQFNLWVADDPEAPRSLPGTDRERATDAPPAGASEQTRSPFPYVSREREERERPDGPEATVGENDIDPAELERLEAIAEEWPS